MNRMEILRSSNGLLLEGTRVFVEEVLPQHFELLLAELRQHLRLRDFVVHQLADDRVHAFH